MNYLSKSVLWLTLVVALCCSEAVGQTRLKSNLLFLAIGAPNVSVETRLSDKFTFNGEISMSFYENIGGKPLKIIQVVPEVRYYIRESFHGFYVGGFAAADAFKISKWGYGAHKYQRGVGICLGATIGYQLKISPIFNLDFYGGFGWHLAYYKGYYTGTSTPYVDWNKSGEWIPYKLGVALSIKL